MQYQLEHHLFPTIPRYKYRHLVPLVKKFAEDNGIEYRATGQWEIIKDNINLVSARSAACLLARSKFCSACAFVRLFRRGLFLLISKRR